MPRRHRRDYPGAWWHVGNRGVDKTDLFREDEDYEHFLRLLALSRRRDWLEFHAWCLMPNHFHLLVRSRGGELARAMQWIQDAYARWFNTKYDQPGHRFESRYWSKLILSLTYRKVALGYIHRNPRDAGLETAGHPYPWTSERDYEAERGRPWVTRTFGMRLPRSIVDGSAVPPELVERWHGSHVEDLRELDQLLRGSVKGLGTWLVRQAGGQGRAGTPRSLVRPSTLLDVLRAGSREAPGASTRAGRRTVSAWSLLFAGLLRTLCASSIQEIAQQTGVGLATAEGRIRRHRRALLEDDRYAMRAGLVLRACLRRDYEGLGAWEQAGTVGAV